MTSESTRTSEAKVDEKESYLLNTPIWFRPWARHSEISQSMLYHVSLKKEPCLRKAKWLC